MYSPKIREDLIPRIYRAARKAHLHMTTWVNDAVEKSLSEAATNHNQPNGRNAVMKKHESEEATEMNRTDVSPFIIAKGETGYRVCSVLRPDRQYIVAGIPNDPQCTCPEFMHPDCPPGWVCEHIQAVLREAPRLEAEANSPPTPLPTTEDGNGSAEPPTHNGKNGNGDKPRKRNGKGLVMLLKRSVSPDGRIDSLSVEFTSPVGSVSTGGIKELAQAILALQTEIAAGFLKANGNGRTVEASGTHGTNGTEPHGSNGTSIDEVPANAVPGVLLGVASMPTKRGVGRYLSILVNERILKLFGTDKQLAQVVSAAGYPPLAGRLVDGFTMNLPCRVVTKPNGKYLNIERVYPPAEAPVPVKA